MRNHPFGNISGRIGAQRKYSGNLESLKLGQDKRGEQNAPPPKKHLLRAKKNKHENETNSTSRPLRFGPQRI